MMHTVGLLGREPLGHLGLLQQLDQSDNQTALGNQGTKQPFQQIDLKGFNLPPDSRYINLGGLAEGLNLLLNLRYIGLGGQAEGFYIGLSGQAEGFYIGLGGQIAVEQIDLFGRQNLGLFLGKAVRRQAFDEFIGVEGNGFAHDQRIYAIPAPDAIINAAPEARRAAIYLNGTLILCMATCVAFFYRKDRLFGIPLPSILLMLGFLIVLSYGSAANIKELSGANLSEYVMSIRRSFGFIVVDEEKGLLLLFLLFALFSRQVKLIVASVATLAFVLALTYVNYAFNVSIESPQHIRASLFEVSEYLFGLGCLFYCLEILLAQGRFAAISRAPFTRLKLPGGRIPFWLMTHSLVIAGSIGLTFFPYFNAMAKTAANEKAYRSITAGEPVVRSGFNVYLIGNELTYTREPCARADTEPPFFLHVIPANVNDLPGDRKQYGFDNLDFRFDRDGGRRFGGKCLATRPLPDYMITCIQTGQYTPGAGQIWTGTFTLNR